MIERISETVAVDADGNVVHPDDITEFQTFPDLESALLDEAPDDDEKSIEVGPSVELCARARFLLIALEHYARGNKLTGYEKTGKSKNHLAVRARRHEHYQRGDDAFKAAFGYEALVASGVDEQDVHDDFVQARYRFKRTYLNPSDDDSANRRARYRRRLEKDAT